MATHTHDRLLIEFSPKTIKKMKLWCKVISLLKKALLKFYLIDFYLRVVAHISKIIRFHSSKRHFILFFAPIYIYYFNLLHTSEQKAYNRLSAALQLQQQKKISRRRKILKETIPNSVCVCVYLTETMYLYSSYI